MKVSDIPVAINVPEADRDADQEALTQWGLGSLPIDLDGRSRGPDGVAFDVQKVHVSTEAEDVEKFDGAQATPLKIINGQPLSKPLYAFLEDEIGAWHDSQDTTMATPERHMFGTIFQDDDGQAWFAGWGVDEAPQDCLDNYSTASLMRISDEMTDDVAENNGPLFENGPMDGEFTITVEETPRVAAIPWWTTADEKIVDGLKERAADMDSPAP